MCEDRNIWKCGLNRLKTAHVIAVPVTDDHVCDRFVGLRSHFGNDRFAHQRGTAGIEQHDSLIGNDEDRVPLLRQLECILSDAGPYSVRELLPCVLKRIRLSHDCCKLNESEDKHGESGHRGEDKSGFGGRAIKLLPWMKPTVQICVNLRVT